MQPSCLSLTMATNELAVMYRIFSDLPDEQAQRTMRRVRRASGLKFSFVNRL